MYPLRKFIPFIKWSLTNFLELVSNIYYKLIRPLLNGHLNYSCKTGSLGIPKCLLLLLNRHHFKSQSRECVVWIFILMFGFIIYCLTCAEQIQWLASLSYNCLNSRLSWLMYQPYNSQDLISNSPYFLLYSSCDVSLENLVLDQLIIP